jgi:hypothetical protein
MTDTPLTLPTPKEPMADIPNQINILLECSLQLCSQMVFSRAQMMLHNCQHTTSDIYYQLIVSGKLNELYFLFPPSPCSPKGGKIKDPNLHYG